MHNYIALSNAFVMFFPQDPTQGMVDWLLRSVRNHVRFNEDPNFYIRNTYIHLVRSDEKLNWIHVFVHSRESSCIESEFSIK